MNKIIAALIAVTFSMGALAQDASAPSAGPAAHEVKASGTHEKKAKKVKKSKRAKSVKTDKAA